MYRGLRGFQNRLGVLLAILGTFPSITACTMKLSSSLTPFFRPTTTTTSLATGVTYYMSPSGSDSNDGKTGATPWLTPNHSGLNCGDTISAAPGTYSAMTISTTPSCSTHNAVFVTCSTFDGCKINQDVWTQGGILVNASYWAFMGWEVTARSGDYAACFIAVPRSTGPSIHDVYFINDVANGCVAGGFIGTNYGTYSVDYLAFVADIAYNASQGSAYCYSGVSVLQPIASDSLAGTHIYLSQIFTWNNVEPPTCYGGQSTDGEGIILDTFNNNYINVPAYDQQAVVENNLAVYNGAFGIFVGGEGNENSHIFIRRNTAYGNFINTNQNQNMCGQIAAIGYPTIEPAMVDNYCVLSQNLAMPSSTNEPGCGNYPAYAYYFGNVNSTDQMTSNAGYSTGGYNVGTVGTISGFTPGTDNVFSSNPNFSNPVQPSAPACAGKASVLDCMSTVIQNFTPANSAVATYGYHLPSTTPSYDSMFPQWLCHSQVPSGLVTMGCKN